METINPKFCSTWRHSATSCDTLRHSATLCDTLRHTATLCDTLRRLATLWKPGLSRNKSCPILQHANPGSINLILSPYFLEDHFLFLSSLGLSTGRHDLSHRNSLKKDRVQSFLKEGFPTSSVFLVASLTDSVLL